MPLLTVRMFPVMMVVVVVVMVLIPLLARLPLFLARLPVRGLHFRFRFAVAVTGTVTIKTLLLPTGRLSCLEFRCLSIRVEDSGAHPYQ